MTAMARILDSFPLNAKGPQFRGDPQWFNGQIWELEVAYDLYQYKNVQVARASLCQYAKLRGMDLKTSISAEADLLTIQATKKPSTKNQLGGTLNDW